MNNDERKQKALEILTDMGLKNLEYLGQGCEGIVFHDGVSVYKVLVPFYFGKNKNETLRRLSYFRNISECQNIYRLEEICEHSGFIIEKYPYERSIPCESITESEAIEFLTACWQEKLIVKDCKLKNFVRVNGKVKLVDLDACGYNDNLFLNMCIRLFLYSIFYNKINFEAFQKLQRSAINNFDLPELEGAREFVNKVFANIIFEESKSVIQGFKIREDVHDNNIYLAGNLPNFENIFYAGIKENKFLKDIKISDVIINENLYFEPQKVVVHFDELKPLKEKVTLLIKTCAQDEFTVEANVKHIVRQLSSPNPFSEIVVLIDSKKSDFLREFNSRGTLNGIIERVQKLQEAGIIDRFVVYDDSKTAEINLRWFNLPSKYAHTTKNIPVSSQLYAFEQCSGDYILQADCDVLIGRKDYNHSFLTDMIAQLKQNERVISVGFNIYNRESKEYFGFDNGSFVPEVRLGLFDKKRFFSLKPFPNELDSDGKLKLSWYRSVEQFQKNKGYYSIRGGDNRTFFIHPQNYRKKEDYSWLTIADRVEQLQIPDVQFGHFDCEGAFDDWCQPKRNEKMVVVSCFRNVSIPRFLRFWCSLMSQTFQDFGLILYDDCSDNGLPFFIEKLIEPYKDRVTFIRSKTRLPKIQCEYNAIHYFCNDPESIIVMIDGDDALIGKEVLNNTFKKYDIWNVDVLVGRVHQTYRLQPHYRYPVNFSRPRLTGGGNVWQHLKTFKKYLFDSIPITHLKYYCADKVKLNKNPWFEKCDDYAVMIPIVEMSKNPLQTDVINYFYDRDYDKRDAERELKERCIAEILNKTRLTSRDVFFGRKMFRPDFESIEIDITYDCNLKCFGCNRSCSQVPTKEHLQLSDIERFIQESIGSGKQWRFINILGGEPTLHKDFLKIIDYLQTYADKFSPKSIIQIVSNGITKQSRELCEIVKNKYKNITIDYASFKTSNMVEYFSPFNDAPIDDENYRAADFTKACWVTSYCGIGLNSRGYYACSVCGGIDRVLNGNNGAKSFSELTEEKLREHYEKFCRLCGNFKHYSKNAGNFIPRCEKEPFKNIISKTWSEIYGRK